MKKSVKATIIIKDILDLRVNLIINKLLALAPAIEKQLRKAITEDGAVQFWANILDSSAISSRNSNSWYSIMYVKAKVRLEKGSKIIVYQDTSAEINVMTCEIIKNIGLAMSKNLKLELISHTNHSCPFLIFYKDVKLTISGLKTRHPIFVVKYRDYDLVLSRLFLKSVKFSQEY